MNKFWYIRFSKLFETRVNLVTHCTSRVPTPVLELTRNCSCWQLGLLILLLHRFNNYQFCCVGSFFACPFNPSMWISKIFGINIKKKRFGGTAHHCERILDILWRIVVYIKANNLKLTNSIHCMVANLREIDLLHKLKYYFNKYLNHKAPYKLGNLSIN